MAKIKTQKTLKKLNLEFNILQLLFIQLTKIFIKIIEENKGRVHFKDVEIIENVRNFVSRELQDLKKELKIRRDVAAHIEDINKRIDDVIKKYRRGEKRTYLGEGMTSGEAIKKMEKQLRGALTEAERALYWDRALGETAFTIKCAVNWWINHLTYAEKLGEVKKEVVNEGIKILEKIVKRLDSILKSLVKEEVYDRKVKNYFEDLKNLFRESRKTGSGSLLKN